MKKILHLAIISILALSSTSCDKWLDVNTNPSSPTNGTASYTTRLPWIQHAYGYAYGSAAGTVACGIGHLGSRSTNAGYADYEPGLGSGPTTPYQRWLVEGASNVSDLIAKATEEGAWHYVAAAKVVKAMGFVLMADIYGEMPFTEAVTGSLSPKYDDGKTIYEGCMALLDEALVDFGKTQAGTAKALSSGDNWNGGNVEKWVKLIHGLKARWLNNMSKKSTYNPDAILAEIAKGPAKNDDGTIIRHKNLASDMVGDAFVSDPLLTSFVFDVAAWGSWARITKWYENLLTNSYAGGSGVIDPRYKKLVPSCQRWADLNGDGIKEKYWDVTKGLDLINETVRVDDNSAPYAPVFTTQKAYDDAKTKPVIKYAFKANLKTDREKFVTNLKVKGTPYKETVNADGSAEVVVTYPPKSWYTNSTSYLRANDTSYLQITAICAMIGGSGWDGSSTHKIGNMKEEQTVFSTGTFYSRPESPTDVITYHEMCFIKAEVLLRKGDEGGAKLAYQEGVKAHIAHMQSSLASSYGISSEQEDPGKSTMNQAEIDAFLASDVVNGPISMAKIMMQKYIAMSFTVQNWNDMRRFNYSAGNIAGFGVVYPDFDRPRKFKETATSSQYFPGTSKIADNYWLRRFRHCSHEINYNNTNLKASNSKALDADIWGVPVWWDKAE